MQDHLHSNRNGNKLSAAGPTIIDDDDGSNRVFARSKRRQKGKRYMDIDMRTDLTDRQTERKTNKFTKNTRKQHKTHTKALPPPLPPPRRIIHLYVLRERAVTKASAIRRSLAEELHIGLDQTGASLGHLLLRRLSFLFLQSTNTHTYVRGGRAMCIRENDNAQNRKSQKTDNLDYFFLPSNTNAHKKYQVPSTR